MTNEEFTKIRGEFNELCESALKLKGDAYTRGTGDRLANFKKCAEDLGITPRQAWSVYFHKHLDAIFYFIKTGSQGPEGIKENIKDARNYLDLLVGLIEEIGQLDSVRGDSNSTLGSELAASDPIYNLLNGSISLQRKGI